MGMNYYLRRKINWDRMNPLPSTLGTGDVTYNWDKNEPTELVNGFVWRNKYYATIEALNTEFYQEIHIGKASAGWRFGLCVYPDVNPRFRDDPHDFNGKRWLERPIANLKDWIELFRDPNNKIYDEDDKEVFWEDMIDIITKRPPRIDPNEVESDGWSKPHDGIRYRVIGGLYVHDFSREPYYKKENYTTIMPADCTYDLILSGNDVEAGSIFS